MWTGGCSFGIIESILLASLAGGISSDGWGTVYVNA